MSSSGSVKLRYEKCLRGWGNATVAAPTHGTGDTVILEHIAEVFAGVLTAAVAVKHQSRLFARMPLEPCHAQGVDDDVACHVMAQ